MSADTCTVSVIVAAYNAAPFISTCLDSMLAQTLDDWEVLVINDHSTDDTAAVVQGYVERDRRFRLMQTPHNAGPAAARNIGIVAARGTWLAVLDADDRYTPERLERMIEYGLSMGSNFVSDNQMIVTSEHAPGTKMFKTPLMETAHHVGAEEFILGNISKRNEPRVAYGYMKPVMMSQFVRDHGLKYNEQMRLAEDFMLYISALQKGARWDYVPEPMYVYSIRDNSLASSSGLPNPAQLRRLFEFSRDLARSEMAQSDPGIKRAALLYFQRVRRWTSYGSLVQYVKKGQVGEVVSLLYRSPDAIGDLVIEAMVQAPVLARKAVLKVPGLSALVR